VRIHLGGTPARHNSRFGMSLANILLSGQQHSLSQAPWKMGNQTGLSTGATPQNSLATRLMLERTLEAANRMVACLQRLHAQFPSDEVSGALLNTCLWRDRLHESLNE
jgi:hypothetical protein